MKRLLWIVSAVLLGVFVGRSEERNILRNLAGSREELTDMLLKNRDRAVTYPAYSDRAAWDSLLGRHKAFYIRNGERTLTYDWPRVRATAYLEFMRSGDRTVMENPLEANNVAMANLLMAELAEGKGRFIDQIIDGIYAAAEMSTWALSAHIPSYNKNSSLQPYDKPVIDLVSADMGSMFAWVHYFLREELDKVNPEISRRLRHEIKTRVLDPYLQSDRWWWDNGRRVNNRMVNNWAPWCLSNILLTSMLMEEDAERYAETAWYTLLGVDKYLNYIKGDGACEEGPSYWPHAAGKVLDYAELLRQATGGDVDASGNALLRAMGEYIARSYVGNGLVVNFADASAKGSPNPFLVYRFGEATGSELLKDFAATLYNGTGTPAFGRDITRTLSALGVAGALARRDKREYRAPESTWYDETEFCYLTTPEGLFFAAKGGNNGESHNHNDIGTFSLWADSYPIIIDAGPGTYTRQTFDSGRYGIWTMQSGWHNVPRINGFEQTVGARYKARAAKAGRNTFSLDLAESYPQEAGIVSWVRAYEVDGREVSITDRFELKEVKEANTVNFLTRGSVDTSTPGKVTIESEGHRAQLLYDPARFEAAAEVKELDDKRLSNVWGPSVTRISLTDRRPSPRGTYRFTLQSLRVISTL